MHGAKRFEAVRKPAAIIILLAGLAVVSIQMGAQGGQGNNAVYSSATSVVESPALIDASAFPSANICTTIYNILTSAAGYGTYPSSGAVIDARSITNLTCTTNQSPWFNGTVFTTSPSDKPSVILLPAGTITSYYTWVLPNNTKIVGQGASTPVTSGTQTGTVITAGTSFSGPAPGYSPTAPLAMIQFGDPAVTTCTVADTGKAGVCFNISVEDLSLNAVGQSIDGILNMNSQELTYARRIGLYNFAETGLQVGTPNYPSQSQNSGPYEQIYSSSAAAGSHCAQIYGAPTRGIHGFTCLSSSNTGGGILLDSTSNSIEDVYVTGFADGILVGSNSTTSSQPWSDALFNISGGGASTNLIHLCKAASSINCTGSVAAQDITILGASSAGGGTTIQDDVVPNGAGTTTTITDPTVGIYALGEPVPITGTASGYSRFTTSQSVPAWFLGSTQLGSVTCNDAKGSIYSATGIGGTGTLWGCIGTNWVKIQ